MQKEQTIDHALRATWQSVAKMYNEQALKYDSTMAIRPKLLMNSPTEMGVWGVDILIMPATDGTERT